MTGKLYNLLPFALRSAFYRLQKTPLLRVYSHPRSGTHFLEAFIGRNFYKDLCLQTYNVEWGHWSNRQIEPRGNVYGLLFGSHRFPSVYTRTAYDPMIYIVRDGRAVAYSIWRTLNFTHRDKCHAPFTEFLRSKLDWYGSPALRSQERYCIIEHWERHVLAWESIQKVNRNVMVVSYESLKDSPYETYLKIRARFFPFTLRMSRQEIDPIFEPVGILPNQATKDAWKAAFTNEDISYFYSKLASGHVKRYLHN